MKGSPLFYKIALTELDIEHIIYGFQVTQYGVNTIFVARIPRKFKLCQSEIIFYNIKLKMKVNQLRELGISPQIHTKSSKSVYFLPLILMFLFITASFNDSDQVLSTQKALLFALLFVVLMSCMYLPDGLIRRPTVFLWKAITGMSFFYLAILIYFAYLNKQNAKGVIHTYFDRGLQNYNYEEVSYGADCRIYTKEKDDPFANVRYAFFDIFAFAHAAGWFIKTLVVRDPKIIIFESIAFQLIEYSLRDVLNNFKECWWDHVIVDVLGCNMLGIVLGFYVIDKFKLERYRWSFRDAPLQTSAWEQFKYFCTHWDLSQLEMKSFSGIKKYLQLSWFCLLFQINDLAVFFLKYIYQIPPSNYMVTLRVIVIGLLCVNASKQFYRYLIRKENSFKINCFMVHMVVLTELFIIFKHGNGDFSHASIPSLGFVFLGLLASLFLIVLAKVLVSDIINWNKDVRKIMKEVEPYPKKSQQKQLAKLPLTDLHQSMIAPHQKLS